MTAVARLTVNKHPLLIGDLLTSWRAASGTQVPLPLVEINYRPEVEIGAKGLHQKIALVDDHIVMGWAGTYSAAADLIGELKQRCEHEHYSSALVEEYLRRQPKSLWQEAGVAGFLFDDEIDNLCSFRCGCRAMESPRFGEMALLGTGGPELEKYFETTTSLQDYLHHR